MSSDPGVYVRLRVRKINELVIAVFRFTETCFKSNIMHALTSLSIADNRTKRTEVCCNCLLRQLHADTLGFIRIEIKLVDNNLSRETKRIVAGGHILSFVVYDIYVHLSYEFA